MDHRGVREKYELIVERLTVAAKNEPKSDYGITSEVWQWQLDKRENAMPPYSELVDFLDGRKDKTSGLTNPEQELDQIFDLNLERIRADYTPEDIAKLRHPFIGRSPMLERDGYFTSPDVLRAVYQADMVCRAAPDLLSNGAQLRALEIGGGYGGMIDQFIQRGVVKKLTSVDLLDNLCLTGFYLSALNPEWAIHVVGADDGAEGVLDDKTITLCLPGYIDRLQAGYDFAVNTSSFGEMHGVTVRAYLNRLAEILTPDGVIISSNSIAFHAAEGFAKRVSDIGYDTFKVLSLSGTLSIRSQYCHHHLIALGLPRNTKPEPAFTTGLNALCSLYRAGHCNDIDDLAARYISGSTTEDENTLLQHIQGVFECSEIADKSNRLNDIALAYPKAPLAIEYMAACVGYLSGDFNSAELLLANVARHSKSPVILSAAGLILTAIKRQVGDTSAMPSDFSKPIPGYSFFLKFADDDARGQTLSSVAQRCATRAIDLN